MSGPGVPKSNNDVTNSDPLQMNQTLLKALSIASLAALVLLGLLRFANLEADFPPGITWSGVLYTDEGWYANAAVRHSWHGEWYLAGDFNPAVNMPVGFLLQRLVFAVFGTSLWSVRICSAVSLVVLAALAALLTAQWFGRASGLLAGLLIVSNYVGFAYSRLAVLEFLGSAFVVAAFFVALYPRSEKTLWRVVLASTLVALAILVKSTMAFAMLPLVHAAWRGGKTRKTQGMLAATAVVLPVVLAGGWHVMARSAYPEDYRYFSELNVGERAFRDAGALLTNVPEVLKRITVPGTLFARLSLAAAGVAWIVSKRYRQNPLVQAWLLFVVGYMALLSVVFYSPPRYYIPLIAPLAGLGAASCREIRTWLKRKQTHPFLMNLPYVLFAPVVLFEAVAVSSYMAQTDSSFPRMARGVGVIMEAREESPENMILLGKVSDSVAIETGVKAVSTRVGTKPLEWKLRHYRPNYFILHNDHEAIPVLLAEGAVLEPLGEWDVHRNYYEAGENIRLFSIHWEQQGDTAPAAE